MTRGTRESPERVTFVCLLLQAHHYINDTTLLAELIAVTYCSSKAVVVLEDDLSAIQPQIRGNDIAEVAPQETLLQPLQAFDSWLLLPTLIHLYV